MVENGLAAIEDVEQVGQGAGENALDAADLVAGFAEVAERADDRQRRTHSRLVQEAGVVPAAHVMQLVVGTRADRWAPSCSA